MKIFSNHKHEWQAHGFTLEKGDNEVDPAKIPKSAYKRLQALHEAGEIRVEGQPMPAPAELPPCPDCEALAAKGRHWPCSEACFTAAGCSPHDYAQFEQMKKEHAEIDAAQAEEDAKLARDNGDVPPAPETKTEELDGADAGDAVGTDETTSKPKGRGKVKP